MEELKYTCAYCGAEFTEEDLQNDRIGMMNGEYICEDCLQEHFIWCDDIEEYVHENDTIQIYTDGYQRDYIYTSESYASANYIWSDYDDCYYSDSDCGYYTEEDGFVGMRNMDNDFARCDDCGAIYRHSDMEYIDEDYYCHSCAEDHQRNNLIYDYHTFDNWQQFKNDDEEVVPYYIGFELEIDNTDEYNLEDVHQDITNNINCILMHDGSLSYRGIEIVSHPQSYNYICSQEKKYRALFEKLTNNYGFTSHENGNCGLHFHVTRPSDEVVDRIQLIMENFKEELILFSRRTSGQLEHWSSFLSNNTNTKREELLSLVTIKKLKDVAESSRYMALNLRNSKTIEFRFIRGTLKYDTFRASLDLINNIMMYANDLSLDLTTLSWADLVNTGYAGKYCIERGIKSLRKLIDNTSKIIKRDEVVAQCKIRYIELLNKYRKYLIKEYNSRTLKISNNLDDIGEKYQHINILYAIIRNIENFKHQNFRSTIDMIDEMSYVARAIDNKYYNIRINNIIKEARDICVL